MSRPCRRAGCPFPANDGYPHCGGHCWAWSKRARIVAQASGPAAEEEAAGLLRLAALLDARNNAFAPVAGVFVHDPADRFKAA